MKVFKDAAFTAICGDEISYGFYGRAGGVSQGIYSSLNCGPGSGDNPDAVAENRRIVATHLGAKGAQISSLSQCHSGDCLLISSHVPTGEARPKADALVTDVPGLAISVLTADCGPVLFTGKKTNGAPVVGAAHAGWGGALGGILEDTVAKMVRAGATLESVKACLGPCITAASYEVGDDLMRPFIIKHEEAERFFMPARKPGHQMFDLPGYIAMRLAGVGVKHVGLMDIDTYSNEADCFSFRRATHRGEKDYGRELSAIVINQ